MKLAFNGWWNPIENSNRSVSIRHSSDTWPWQKAAFQRQLNPHSPLARPEHAHFLRKFGRSHHFASPTALSPMTRLQKTQFLRNLIVRIRNVPAENTRSRPLAQSCILAALYPCKHTRSSALSALYPRRANDKHARSRTRSGLIQAC